MGSVSTKEISTPTDLLNQCMVYHKQGDSGSVFGLLKITSERIRSGGLLACQILGRIDSSERLTSQALEERIFAEERLKMDLIKGIARLDEGDDAELKPKTSLPHPKTDRGGGVRLRVGFQDKPAVASASGVKIGGLRKDPKQDKTPEKLQFQLPSAIVALSQMTLKCTHTSCKIGFLLLARVAGMVSNHSLCQRTDNQKAFGETAVKVVLAVLGHKLSMDDISVVGDVVRAYAKICIFRSRFLSANGAPMLSSKIMCFTSKRWPWSPPPTATILNEPHALIPVLGSLRLLVVNEMIHSDSALETANAIISNCDLPQLVQSIITLVGIDDNTLVELCELTCIILQLQSDVNFLTVAMMCEKYLAGVPGWEPVESSLKYMAKALCFCCRGCDTCLRTLIPLGLVATCRRIVIKAGVYDVVLFYIILTLEYAINHIIEQSDIATAHSDETVLGCLDTLSSALTRLVACVDSDVHVVADCIGKVCWLIAKFTKHSRHQALLLSHPCCHLIGKCVLRDTSYPDWVLVPCIEIIGSVVGCEASALALQRDQNQIVFRVNDTVVLLCRLLRNSKRNPAMHSKSIEVSIGVLFRLCCQQQNAQIVFENITIAELWMWANLGVHFQKEAERYINARWLAAEYDGDKEELEFQAANHVQEELEANSRKAQYRSVKVAALWKEIDLVFPPCLNIEWEAELYIKPEVVLESIKTIESITVLLQQTLLSHSFFKDYNETYEDKAAKLQKWYRKKQAWTRFYDISANKYTERKAALTIQKVWRGRIARKLHVEALLSESRRRSAAELIQVKWRKYLKHRILEAKSIRGFICKKMGMSEEILPEAVNPPPGTRFLNYAVDINEENIDTRLFNKDQPVNSLVCFYTPWCTVSAQVAPTYEQTALIFRDYSEVVIAKVNCEDNPVLSKRFKVEYTPFFVWIDDEGLIHDYDAEWPKKPLTISQLIENFMALEIQRIWKGMKVKKAYRILVSKVRTEITNLRRKSIRIACQSNETERLSMILEQSNNPNEMVDTGEIPINICIKMGHKECFALLVKRGANINLADDNGHTPVFYAAAAGLHEVLRMLAKRGANINHRDKQGRTILHVACETGNDGVALLLINMGLDTQCFVKDNRNCTPLDYSLLSGLESVSMKLLLKGVTVHRDMEDRMLYHVMIKGMEGITRVIIRQGLTDLNSDDGTPEKWTPLHYAACMDFKTIVKELIEAGCDLTPRNSKGQTPLHVAAKKGAVVSFEILFQAMAVPVSELLEMRPLFRRAEEEDEDPFLKFGKLDSSSDIQRISLNESSNRLLQPNSCEREDNPLLPKVSSDLSIGQVTDGTQDEYLGPFVDNGGNTILHYTCNHPLMSTISERLLRDITDDNDIPGPNLSGNTPLHFACAKGNYFVAFHLARRLVYSYGCDEINGDGNTALHLAMINGHRDVVSMLLDIGADYEIADYEGNSLLHFACVGKLEGKARQAVCNTLLTTYNHPVNICNDGGITPLHLAASQGYLEVVQDFIMSEENVDARVKFINLCDNDGNTALHFAALHGKQETNPRSQNYPANHPMILFLVVEGADPDTPNKHFDRITPASLISESFLKRARQLRAEKVEEEKFQKMIG